MVLKRNEKGLHMFFPLSPICLSFRNTEGCKEGVFSWHGYFDGAHHKIISWESSCRERGSFRVLPGMGELSCPLPTKRFEG